MTITLDAIAIVTDLVLEALSERPYEPEVQEALARETAVRIVEAMMQGLRA